MDTQGAWSWGNRGSKALRRCSLQDRALVGPGTWPGPATKFHPQLCSGLAAQAGKPGPSEGWAVPFVQRAAWTMVWLRKQGPWEKRGVVAWGQAEGACGVTSPTEWRRD